MRSRMLLGTVLALAAMSLIAACMSDQQLRQARAAKPVKVCEVWAGELVPHCTYQKEVNADRTIAEVNKAMNVPDTQHGTPSGY